MATHSGDPGLQGDVAEAVRQAAATGEAVSRAALVRRFHNRGASRASLFQWVDAAIQGQAVAVAGKERRIGRPVGEAIKAEALAREAGARPPLDGVEVEDDKAVPFLAIVQGSLRQLDHLAQACYAPDGTIRRPFPLLRIIDQRVKVIAQGMRIEGAWRDKHLRIEEERRLMRDIIGVVAAEEPAVAARILSRMRALGHEPNAFK